MAIFSIAKSKALSYRRDRHLGSRSCTIFLVSNCETLSNGRRIWLWCSLLCRNRLFGGSVCLFCVCLIFGRSWWRSSLFLLLSRRCWWTFEVVLCISCL